MLAIGPSGFSRPRAFIIDSGDLGSEASINSSIIDTGKHGAKHDRCAEAVGCWNVYGLVTMQAFGRLQMAMCGMVIESSFRTLVCDRNEVCCTHAPFVHRVI